MSKSRFSVVIAALMSIGMFGTAHAQQSLQLTSPLITDGGTLPLELKCSRDGGQGLSPPVAWNMVPEGTHSLALIMYHYPKGTAEDANPPSQYWLLWNIPVDAQSLPEGNPASLGDEGSDKDAHGTGYTPPCSPRPWWTYFSSKPQQPEHKYVIKLFALDEPLTDLPDHDDKTVDWATMTKAMDNKIIASSEISFWN